MERMWIKTDEVKEIFNSFLSNTITKNEVLDQLEKKSVCHQDKNKQLIVNVYLQLITR